MQPLLLTVGNIYFDHNIFGVNTGDQARLAWGKDYFAASGGRVLGGSAVNVAMQAKGLGLAVGFIGKTGTDMGGDEVRELLTAQGILDDLVHADPTQVTSMAVNLIDTKGEFIGVHYGGASRTLAAADIDLNHELVKQCQAIYFGGTAKQPLLFKDCQGLFRKLSEKGIKVFYDPNRFPPTEALADRSLLRTQLKYVEGYFPNEEELLQATDKSDIDAALSDLLSTGVKFVAVKLGARGCRVKTAKDDFTVAARKVTVLTTVGAGDCFNAAFMAYYLKGASLKECAKLATLAASIKVSQNIWPDEAAIKVLV
jgi:ribokinase